MFAQHEIVNDLFVYSIALLVGLLAAEISKRGRQSEVIGQVLVGIILGPYVLGILRPSTVIEFISMLGAITLLFIAGLETDIRMILKSGPSATVLAIGGFAFTILLILPLVFFVSSNIILAVFMGFALSATSIGITVRVFSDFGKLREWEAQTIVVAAVLDDLLVILFLVPVVDAVAAGAFSPHDFFEVLVPVGFFMLGLLIFGVLFVLYVAPRLWLLESRGAIIIFSFGFALFIGFLAAYVGLSPIVGAYFAGLILAETEMRDEILTGVSQVAFLTVPIFMINIGMKIDVGVLGEAILVGLAVCALAVLGKLIGGIIAGKIRGAKGKSPYVLGMGMVPRSEVVLIFAEIGLLMNIIDAMWYAVLVVVVLITTFLTPLVLKYLLVGGDTSHDKNYKDDSRRHIGASR